MYDGLPEACFALMPGTGQLIYLKRGESGYYPSTWDTGNAEKNREIADYLNERSNVTRAQEEAMQVGSMFGWDRPGADPRKYEQEVHEGYSITKRTVVGKREIVFGESKTNPAPYVVWMRTPGNDKPGRHDYYWGHYFSDYYKATLDFDARVAAEREEMKAGEHRLSKPLKYDAPER